MIRQKANCQNCIHCDVCHLKETCYDMEVHLRAFGCENFFSKESVLQTRIPIGTTVYQLTSAVTDAPVVVNGETLYRRAKRWRVTHFQYEWMNAVCDLPRTDEELKKIYFFDKDEALAERDRLNEFVKTESASQDG